MRFISESIMLKGVKGPATIRIDGYSFGDHKGKGVTMNLDAGDKLSKAQMNAIVHGVMAMAAGNGACRFFEGAESKGPRHYSLVFGS